MSYVKTKFTHSVQRIGLLGGTFDPPHMGHLWLGESAREQLQLDEVLFLPVGDPPHKADKPVTAVAHRTAMTQLAIAHNPAFTLNTTDQHRPPPHTTATLLPLIQQQYPQAQLWLLLGADSLRDLPTWASPEQLIAQCRLAVLSRPGVQIEWEQLKTAVPGIDTAVDLLSGPTIALSATELRAWAAQGYSLRYAVDTAVEAYIQQHHLYAPPDTRRP